MKLSLKQVVASVIGALLGALALSFLGVGGTLVGVAAGSAAATVGSALAFHSLERGHQKVRQIISSPTAAPAPPSAEPAPVEGLTPRQLTSSALPAAPAPPPLHSAPAPRRWPILAVVGLVFGLSLGVLSVVELALGKPISVLVGSQPPTQRRTTIGDLVAPGTTTTSSSSTTTSSTTSTTRPGPTSTTRPTTSTTHPTTTTRPSTTTSSTTSSTTTTTTSSIPAPSATP